MQDGHLVVAHLYRLGFVINREKSVLCPKQITHFLGMVLDSTSIINAIRNTSRINAIKTCVRQFRLGQSVSSLCCQRLLGMMASAAIALPLGMLRMRPFQIWYLSEAQRSHRQAPQSSGVLQMQESPGDLQSPLVSRRVGHYGHSVALRSGDHRRLHHGVGGSLRRKRRERSLVCDRGRVSYKCVRTADSSPGSTTLSAQTEWSACVSEDGQHCGLGVC